MADAQEPLRNLLPSGVPLERDAARRAEPELFASLLAEPMTAIVELHGGRAQVVTETERAPRLATRVPLAADVQWAREGGLTVYLGTVGATPVVAVLHAQELGGTEGDASEPAGVTLREVGVELPDSDLAVFQTALALFHWHERHPRCPRCGAPMIAQQAGWVRVCEADGSEHYPRTDPAVIMAIVDADDRLLLARGSRWKGPHRSVLAGFVEPGESFEQAVARETFEESGVVVDEVTYLGNQPWPFPASLMIGFMARARTRELTPEAGEIEEIAWYSRADVDAGLADGTLRLPGHLSIARALIERWYGAPLAAQDFS